MAYTQYQIPISKVLDNSSNNILIIQVISINIFKDSRSIPKIKHLYSSENWDSQAIHEKTHIFSIENLSKFEILVYKEETFPMRKCGRQVIIKMANDSSPRKIRRKWWTFVFFFNSNYMCFCKSKSHDSPSDFLLCLSIKLESLGIAMTFFKAYAYPPLVIQTLNVIDYLSSRTRTRFPTPSILQKCFESPTVLPLFLWSLSHQTEPKLLHRVIYFSYGIELL